MSFEWTAHRFVSGALALDVANSIILRFDPKKRIDRFADRDEISRFTEAAGRLSAERGTFACLEAVPDERQEPFLSLREAIDRYFRLTLLGDNVDIALADLLEQIAATLRASSGDPDMPLDKAAALSALNLIHRGERQRMKICSHCEWLFLDRSKNRSRTWCDMAVCGNRVKARLHYSKRKQEAMS